MENINNIIDSDIPTQSKRNIFKYLFFISILVLLTGFTYFYLTLKSINTKLLIIESNNKISQTIPTITPETKVSYLAQSIDDPQNKIVKLILKDSIGNETIVDEAEYWQLPGGQTIIPQFNNIKVNSDNKYLFYFKSDGFEGGVSYLYKIESKQKLNLEIATEEYGFDQNNKYFFVCDGGPGMGDGGASIYNLQTMEMVYKAPENCYKCQLNSNNNIEIIEHESCTPNNPKTIEFLTKTGTIKQ